MRNSLRPLSVPTIVPVLLAISWCCAPILASDKEGEPIVLGMTTALSGPAEQLGRNMRDGVLAAIEEVNTHGGIHGRKLQLIALDDGYEPSRTAPNMRELIDQRNVLAVVGNVGTPTAVAAIPIANEKQTLLFGAFTGAGVLRKTPPDRYVINYRASYAEETAAMVDALVKHAGIRPNEIGFFTQRDAYGDAGYVGGIAAMKRHGLRDDTWIVHGRYERNTTAVENALADLMAARTPVKAVIMVGAYQPCAEFIHLAHEFDFHPRFLNVSFVGAAPLAHALGHEGDGVLVTQVVPHPDADLPLATDFHHAIANVNEGEMTSFGAFEGYIVGRIFVCALQSIDGPITRESAVNAMEHLGTFDIGLGQTLELRRDEHQACHSVWPTIIRDGRVDAITWDILQSDRDRS